jgi:preprotein translocase subunit SecE
LTKPQGFLILVADCGRWREYRVKPFMDYLSASRAELAKVSWPNRQQTIRLTILVIAFSLVMAAVLGSLDAIFQGLVQKVIG